MNMKMPVWGWAVLSCALIPIIGLLDWETGYELNFFVFYFLPVALAGWFAGMEASLALSVLCALTWAGADYLSGHQYSSHVFAVWNTTVRLVSFIAIGLSVSKIRSNMDRERATAESLRKALSEVKVLETFLPVCAQCKKIRNKDGTWQHMEVYIGEHSNTKFSHGYCPDCARKAMEEAGLFLQEIEQPK